MQLSGVDSSHLVSAEDDEDHGGVRVEVMDLVDCFEKLLDWKGFGIPVVAAVGVAQPVGEIKDGKGCVELFQNK